MGLQEHQVLFLKSMCHFLWEAPEPPLSELPPPPPTSTAAVGTAEHAKRMALQATAMHFPFQVADVAALAKRVERRKSLAGSLLPWLFKAAVLRWHRHSGRISTHGGGGAPASPKPGANPTSDVAEKRI